MTLQKAQNSENQEFDCSLHLSTTYSICRKYYLMQVRDGIREAGGREELQRCMIITKANARYGARLGLGRTTAHVPRRHGMLEVYGPVAPLGPLMRLGARHASSVT